MNLAHICGSVIFISTVALTSNIPNDELPSPHVVPWHYNLKLSLYFEKNDITTSKPHIRNVSSDDFFYHVETRTNINILRSIQNVTLHARNLQSTNWARLIKSDGAIYGLNQFIHNYEENLVLLYFTDEILPGFYTLETIFIDNVRDDNAEGFFRSTYMYKNKEWFIASFTQTNEARRLFPCWDEPQLKTTFTISVKNNRNLTTLSNMPKRVDQPYKDNLTWTHFYTTPPMSTYQVAIVVTNFSSFQINKNINLWCKQWSEHSMKFAEYAIKNITFHLEAEFDGIKIPKTDHIVIPNFPHDDASKWGLIIHREINFIYEESLDPFMHKVEIARLIAFKIAHQWFSNAVSPSWWYHFWLHDGLAALYGEEAVMKIFINFQLMDFFIIRNQYESLHLNSHFNMNPPQINSLSEANSVFKFPRYIKALIILRMNQNVIGIEAFRKSVHTFLQKYKFRSVTLDEFLSTQEDEVNKYYISYAYQAWISHEHYPTITWKEDNPSNGKLMQIDTFTTLYHKWWIHVSLLIQPFLFMTDKVWLTPLQSSLDLNYEKIKDNLIMVDFQQAGYYRANYETKHWFKISNYLNSGKYTMSVINRAKVIDDTFHFMIQHQLNISVFWEIAKYMPQEMDFVGWYPMFKVFEYMSSMIPFSKSETFIADIKEKIIKLLSGPLMILGFEERFAENNLRKCFRHEIVRWACIHEHSACMQEANYKIGRLLYNTEQYRTLPRWKERIYCKGLMQADNSTLYNVAKLWLTISDYKRLSYLDCSHPVFIVRLLHILSDHFTDRRRRQDIIVRRTYINIFHSIIMKHANNDYVLQDMLLSFEKVKPKEINIITALMDIINYIYSPTLFNRIFQYVESQSFINEKQISIIRHKVELRLSEIQNLIENSQKLFLN